MSAICFGGGTKTSAQREPQPKQIARAESFDGELPPKQLKMVQAWIEIHKEELMVDWELAVNGEDPFRIAPLQ